MEERPCLARLHPLDAAGAITRETRDRFALFSSDGSAALRRHMASRPSVWLRMCHAHVPVDSAMRDAWVRCMRGAMESTPMPDALRGFLELRFAEVAELPQRRIPAGDASLRAVLLRPLNALAPSRRGRSRRRVLRGRKCPRQDAGAEDVRGISRHERQPMDGRD